MSPAAKGKRQVVLTLSTEAYEKLWELATENDRTLAGYLILQSSAESRHQKARKFFLNSLKIPAPFPDMQGTGRGFEGTFFFFLGTRNTPPPPPPKKIEFFPFG